MIHSRIRQILGAQAVLLAAALAIAGTAGLRAQEPKPVIRNVTPEGIPVIILPPRDELRARSPVLALPDLEPPVKVSLDPDGSLMVANRRWHLAGIAALSAETLCTTATGERWACGVRAFVALRRLLHGQELRCSQIAARGADAVVRCAQGGVDVSQTVLLDGWALRDEAESNQAYDEALAKAQQAGRGIWQNGSKPVPEDALRASGAR